MKAFAMTLLLVASAASAQSSIDPSGHSEGMIEIPNNPTAFEIELPRTGNAELVGTFAAVDAVRVPLVKVTLEGQRLGFYGRSDQPFQAELLPNGASMSRRGMSLPLSFTRETEGER